MTFHNIKNMYTPKETNLAKREKKSDGFHELASYNSSVDDGDDYNFNFTKLCSGW